MNTDPDGNPYNHNEEQSESAKNDLTPEVNTMLKNEIMSTIKRYGRESNVTVYAAIGVLEVCKLNLSDMLKPE